MRPLHWFWRRWNANDLFLYIAVILITSLLTVTALELWRSNIAVPFTYWGDALAVGSHFKTVQENGWYEFNPLLGAPFGQTYNDFPTADNLNFVWAKVLGWFISDWAVAMNVYFLIGFPLAAASAVWLFRVCGLSRPVTLALAPIFALAPYHFIRSEGHLFLASYYLIPISLVLVIRAIRGERLWGVRESSGWSGRRPWNWLLGRGAGTVAIAALTGTTQTYYAVFFLILIAFAGVVSLIRTHAWKRFWGAAMAGVLTLVAMLINMAPDSIYEWVNGANPGGFARGHADSEIYALKLSQLLLPWSGHRIAFLKNLRAAYDSTYPLPSENPALGAIGALGLVALFLVLAYFATTGGRIRLTGWGRERFDLLLALASLVFVAFLFSTIGGLSTLISFLTTSLRGWNRIAIYISALCLIAVGILLDALIRRVVLKRALGTTGRRVLAGGIVVLVLGVGYIDQTPADVGAGYAATIQHFDNDQAWFARVQAAVPPGGTVLQLPYITFPEDSGPTGVLASEMVIPYLQTHGIHWTGAGIKGRPRSDWSGVVEEQYSPAQIAELAAAAGMDGIHLDRQALEPGEDSRLEAGLTAETGVTPMVSADGRYVYFSLASERSKLEASHSTAELDKVEAIVTDPITLDERTTFTRSYTSDGSMVSTSAKPGAVIKVVNATGAAVPGTLTLELSSTPGGASPLSSVVVTLPDGSTHTVALTETPTRQTFTLSIPNGLSTISFSSPGASATAVLPLTLGFRSFVDTTTADFLAG